MHPLLIPIVAIAIFFLVNSSKKKEESGGGKALLPGLPESSQIQEVKLNQEMRFDGFAPPPPSPFLIDKIVTGKRKRNHNPNSLASCMYLVTFLNEAKKAKLFETMVMSSALSPHAETLESLQKANAFLEAGNEATSAVSKALDAAAKGKGFELNSSNPIIQSVTAMISAIYGLVKEEDKRIAESKACAGFVYEFTRNFGLPPMGLLHAMAHYIPKPNYSVIAGNGTFLRHKEWGPGIVASMVILYHKLVNDGWIGAQSNNAIKGVPFSKRKNFQKTLKDLKINQVFGGRFDYLKVSRFAEWTRYVFHPYYVLSDTKIPQRWKKNHYDSYRAGLQLTSYNDPFLFARYNMKKMIEEGGVSLGVYNGMLQPGLLIFTLGHDPGMDVYPQPLLGILPGNYGTINFNKKDWEKRVDIYTNVGGWFYT